MILGPCGRQKLRGWRHFNGKYVIDISHGVTINEEKRLAYVGGDTLR